MISDVTVIGLGAMGTALARTLMDAGRNVTVWNRSPEKMEPLVALGAQGPSDFGEALAASPRAIVCIPDYQTTAELFERPDVTPLLNGRTVVQLSTGTPKEAKESEEWFNGLGASYLDGAILCWPGNIGTPSGLILVAGQEPVFEDCQTDLQHLAGDLRYLGSNIVGPASVSQLDGYVKALDFELSPDEIAFLDGLYRPRDVINGQVRHPMPRHLGGVQTDA